MIELETPAPITEVGGTEPKKMTPPALLEALAAVGLSSSRSS
jgi:hypothetical protein